MGELFSTNEEDAYMEDNSILKTIHEKTLEIEDYKRHFKKLNDLGRKIMRVLGKDAMIFLEYEITTLLNQDLKLQSVYKAGFKDGIRAQQIAQQKRKTHLNGVSMDWNKLRYALLGQEINGFTNTWQ